MHKYIVILNYAYKTLMKLTVLIVLTSLLLLQLELTKSSRNITHHTKSSNTQNDNKYSDTKNKRCEKPFCHKHMVSKICLSKQHNCQERRKQQIKRSSRSCKQHPS